MVAVQVMDFQRYFTGHRMTLIPTTLRALFAIPFQHITAHMMRYNTFGNRTGNQPLPPLVNIMLILVICLAPIGAINALNKVYRLTTLFAVTARLFVSWHNVG
jgi:hypothetical protein